MLINKNLMYRSLSSSLMFAGLPGPAKDCVPADLYRLKAHRVLSEQSQQEAGEKHTHTLALSFLDITNSS